MAVTICIFNEKGGVGKTTSCLNVSAYIATRQYEVLAVDTDPQANLTEGLGIRDHSERANLLDFFNEEADRDLIQATDLDKLSIIPATAELKAVELKAEIGTELVLSRYLAELEDDFDFIFIDSPPSLGKLAVGGMTASDYFLIPVQAEYYPLRGVDGAIQNYELIKKRLNPGLNFLGAFMTMYDARTNLSKRADAKCREFFGDKMFATRIRRNVSLAESPAVGESIFTFDPNANGAEDYEHLALEILERVQNKV